MIYRYLILFSFTENKINKSKKCPREKLSARASEENLLPTSG